MISIIVAQARNGVIGNRGELPWKNGIPADLARFKELTLGHPVIMGRRTYESLPASVQPLPKRTNIILSRNPEFCLPKCESFTSLEAAVDVLVDQDVFVIGGGEVYLEALPLADRVYLTIVDHHFEGDVVFPPLGEDEWEIIEKSPLYPAEPPNRYRYQFVTYERVNK